MKKIALLIIGLLTSFLVQAQEVQMGFIPFHHPGYRIFNIRNCMQQSDGDVVSDVLVASLDGNNPVVVGNVFYKASPTELQYVDSLFVADSLPPSYLLVKDPLGGGNLRVNIEPDGNGGTALRISHFTDNDLNINAAEDIVVQLCDTVSFDHRHSYMMDSRNDLIIKYYTESLDGSYVCHIARVGLDGTLKHTAVLPQNQNFLITMGEFDSPSGQYFQWTINSDRNLLFYVIDSTFHVKNYHVVNKQLENVVYFDSVYIQVMESFWFNDSNMNGTFVIPDEGDLLVAARYTRDSTWVYDETERGLAVARYDLRTMQRKALVHFNDQPGPETEARCMCFQKASDGNLYLVYREPTPNNKPTMTVAKMDRDLNLIWKRYCYDQAMAYDPYSSMHSSMLNDNEGNEAGIYIVGYASPLMQAGAGIFHFFLTDDGLTTVKDGSIAIRPYTYYPNPAQDRLHLQYSPDVKPAQVELYDLQGRLVRTRSQGFESINLQGLAPGQYLMKVTLEDGKIYSDKVVKE